MSFGFDVSVTFRLQSLALWPFAPTRSFRVSFVPQLAESILASSVAFLSVISSRIGR
jgi:hypothetical protein